MSDTDVQQVSSPPSSEPAPSAPSTAAPAPQTQSDQGATTQPSPGTPKGTTERQGLLAAVQDVVKVDEDPIVIEPRPDAAPAAPSPGAPSPTSTTAQPPADPLQADPNETELSTYKPDTRRRIEQLLAQRNEARQTSERFKGDAEAFAQFRSYQQAHQLENDDVNLLLATGAALRRGDFKAFLDGVMPYVDVAQQALGISLPADLHQQVENGQIPVETAREISINRIQNARLQTESNSYRDGMELQNQQVLANRIYDSVAAWETQTKARDPDWALKKDIVERFSQSIVMSEGRPTSPQQAVAMAQKAYEEANRVVERMRPQPVPTRQQPSGVHQTTGNGAAAPEPRNLMEAAILGLQRGHARVH